MLIDFKERSVSPTQYTINPDNAGHYVKSWQRKGSNDSLEWKQPDSQNTSELTSTSPSLFTVPDTSKQPSFRYSRLRQTSTNNADSHQLAVVGFKIFGRLKSKLID
jgi:hypothetical protein